MLKDLFLHRKENLRSQLLLSKSIDDFIDLIVQEISYYIRIDNDFIKSLTFSETKIVNELLISYKKNYLNFSLYVNEANKHIVANSDSGIVPPVDGAPNADLIIGASSGTISGAIGGGILGGLGGAAIGLVVSFLFRLGKDKSATIKQSEFSQALPTSIDGFDIEMQQIVDEVMVHIEKYVSTIDNVIEFKRNDAHLTKEVIPPKNLIASDELMRAIHSLISVNIDENETTPKYTSLSIKNISSVLESKGVKIIYYKNRELVGIDESILFDFEESVEDNRTTIETVSPAFVMDEKLLIKGRVTLPKNTKL